MGSTINISYIESTILKNQRGYTKEIEKGEIYIPRYIELGTWVLIFKNSPGDKLKAKWHLGYRVIGLEGKE